MEARRAPGSGVGSREEAAARRRAGNELVTVGAPADFDFAMSRGYARRERRGCAAALVTTAVREQHRRSRHKGATRMQTHPAVSRVLTGETDCCY